MLLYRAVRLAGGRDEVCIRYPGVENTRLLGSFCHFLGRLREADLAANRRLCRLHLRLIGMILARPEETAQAVPFAAGDDVHVQMGHALAHAVVDGDERAFRSHAALDSVSQLLRVSEERREQIRREVLQRLKVPLGYEQRVARKERAMVQESERQAVFKNNVARRMARDELTKLACAGFRAQGFPAAVPDAMSMG